MRRVPEYLIIGNGRVARHMLHYFALLGIETTHWHRQKASPDTIRDARYILILLSDNAIETFITEHLHDKNGLKIHFSGALVTSLAVGAHPLMTFGPDLYELSQYQKIPFVLDDDAPDFTEIFPAFKNPHTALPKQHKAKYHALCVMAANYSCLLWAKLFDSFERELNLPAETAYPLLAQQTENLLSDYQNALTGPLLRGDSATLDKHIKALEGDSYQDIYQSFIHAYRKDDTC